MFIDKEREKGRFTKIISIVLMMVNVPIILWNAIYGFLPQTFGSAFFLAATVGVLYLENWKNDKIWSIITTALLFAAEALVYNEMLPFLVLVTFVLVIKDMVQNKEDRKLTLLLMSLCALVSVTLIITYVGGMIEATLTMFGGIVGWHQDKDIFTYIAYYLSTVPAEYSYHLAQYSMKWYLYEIFTLVLMAVIIIGFYKCDKLTKVEFLCVSLPYLLMFLYFMFFSENPFIGGKGNSWSIYKLMQYYFVLAIPYIAIFYTEATAKLNKWALGVSIFVFCVFNINNAIGYMDIISQNMENYVGKEENSIEEYYALWKKYGGVEEIITLYNVPQKHRQMVTYFLKDVKLLSDWNSDGYYNNIPMTSQELFGTGVNLVYNSNNENAIAQLVESDAEVRTGEGFYDMESSELEYWNWSQNYSVLDVIKYATEQEFILCFDALGVNQEKEEKLVISSETGKTLQEVNLRPGELENVTLIITEDVNRLYFEYSGENQSTESDSRKLAFAIKNYSIQ